MVPSALTADSEHFPHMKAAIIESAAALLRHGHNLIVDIVCMPAQTARLREMLAAFDPFVVGVTASLPVLQARELARGDRQIGLSHSQYPAIHRDVMYDMEIDTSNLTAEQAAFTIIKNITP
jgi:chloramphenicol 3-O phosphotransferase